MICAQKPEIYTARDSKVGLCCVGFALPIPDFSIAPSIQQANELS